MVFSVAVTGNTVTGAPVARLRSDEPVATGATVTKPIHAGSYYTQAVQPGTSYGLAFEPLGSGTATVTVTGPAGVVRMTTGSRQVSVTAPSVSVPGNATVGAGLMLSSSASLSSSQHGGVTVTVQSSNPSRVLVSPDSNTAGTASFSRVVPNGSTSIPYYLHGLENVTGTATVTVSASGFTPGSGTVTVATSGVEILSLPTTTTNLSSDSTQWYVQVGLPCSGNTNLCSVQIRARRRVAADRHPVEQQRRGGAAALRPAGCQRPGRDQAHPAGHLLQPGRGGGHDVWAGLRAARQRLHDGDRQRSRAADHVDNRGTHGHCFDTVDLRCQRVTVGAGLQDRGERHARARRSTAG